MDTLTFISAIVSSLAWPLVLIAALVILRRPLGQLIPLLQRIKYKDFELEFGRKLDDIKSKMELEPVEIPTDELIKSEERIAKLAEVSPRAAVLEAWRQLELKLSCITQKQAQIQGKTVTKLSVQDAMLRLAASGVLTPSTSGTLRELRYLRNQSAHAPDFALSVASALEYARVAGQLAAMLEKGA